MPKGIDVYEQGFGMGVQGLPLEPAQSKHSADWDGMRASHKKEHEARIAVLGDRLTTIQERDLPQAERDFDAIRARVHKCPSRFAAMLLLLMAVAAVLLDAFMVAPSFELLFATHIEQLAVALVVLVFSTVLLHACWKKIGSVEPRERYIGIVGCIFVGLLLVAMGLERGRVVEADGLATVFFVLATLVTPVAGASCSVSGIERLKEASYWRKAEKTLKNLRAECDATEAELKTAKVHLIRGDEEIVARQQAQAHGLQMGHNAGKLGVTREPLVHAIMKAVVVVAVTLMMGFFLPISPVIIVATAVAVGGAAFVLFNNRRNHPDDTNLSRQRTISFTPETNVYKSERRSLEL